MNILNKLFGLKQPKEEPKKRITRDIQLIQTFLLLSIAKKLGVSDKQIHEDVYDE